jgi:glycosyltransferase involved in cell wall biosynthesis
MNRHLKSARGGSNGGSPRSTQFLWERIGGSVRGAVAAALPCYRRFVTPELRLLIPEGVRSAAKRTFGIKDPLIRVHELKLRLNELGFVERALEDLRALSQSPDATERLLATWELAVWNANRRSPEGSAATLTLLDRASDDIAHTELHRREAILRSECHALLGNVEAARAVIAAALQNEQHPDLHLAAANLSEHQAEQLTCVNDALRLYNLPQLSLRPANKESPYDSLSVAERLPVAAGPKVSVIVPAFNAAEHIATSMEALIAQTWQNLEVLVVDDSSTDSTADLIAAFSERDPRIRLIRADVNRGSYVARNIALREASGDFITTHDSDDWSHPKKLEIQARELMRNPNTVANMSHQARATSDLVFHRRGSPGHYIFDNMSSLMFRREPVAAKLGFWDSVRFGADSELIERIRLTFGRKAVASVPLLLSFQRQSETSLTGSSAFGYHGFLMGARQAYHEVSRAYHRRSRDLFYEFFPTKRPFAVPEPMWPIREVAKGERRQFDVILVSDFRMPGDNRANNIAYLEAEMRPGCRVGLVQMAKYDFDPTALVLPVFRDLEDACAVQFIAFGERVSCRRLVILDACVLEDSQRYVPDIDAEDIEVLVKSATIRSEALSGWLEVCMQNACRYFGRPGVWTTEDPALCELLKKVRGTRKVG